MYVKISNHLNNKLFKTFVKMKSHRRRREDERRQGGAGTNNRISIISPNKMLSNRCYGSHYFDRYYIVLFLAMANITPDAGCFKRGFANLTPACC